MLLKLNRINSSGQIALICAALASTPASALSLYAIDDLGVIGRAAAVGALNDAGQAAFWLFAQESDGDSTAAPEQTIFFDGGSNLMLPSLGGTSNFVTDINDNGVIVGGSSDPRLGRIRAVRYVNGLIEDLKIPALNGSAAFALNNSGQIVGTAFLNFGSRAFLSNAPGHAVNLGTLGGAISSATDINNHGVVVGWSELPPVSQFEVHSKGFIYKAGVLHPLDVLGSSDNFAHAINDLEQIVGTFGVGTIQQPEIHAFLFDPINGPTDLGSSGLNSTAFDINELGTIVGNSERIPDSSDYRAFVYDSAHGMRFLEDLISPHSGWDKLYTARSINNRGQILGQGIINGEMHVFLLSPVPEPSSLALLFAASIGSGAFSRKRRRNS